MTSALIVSLSFSLCLSIGPHTEQPDLEEIGTEEEEGGTPSFRCVCYTKAFDPSKHKHVGLGRKCVNDKTECNWNKQESV